MQFLKHYGLTR